MLQNIEYPFLKEYINHMGKVFAYDTWSFYFVIGKLFLSFSYDIYPRQQIIYFTKRVDNLILYPFQPKCRAFKNLLQESLLRNIWWNCPMKRYTFCLTFKCIELKENAEAGTETSNFVTCEHI